MLIVWKLKVPYILRVVSLFWNRSPKTDYDNCEWGTTLAKSIQHSRYWLHWCVNYHNNYYYPIDREKKSKRKDHLHQWKMIQASIKACYSDYSSIDVGSQKNSLNQFNPMNWHGLVNEWMRNHRRTKTPSAQATRSTLVLMHGATNRAGYELYSFI